MRLLYFSLVLLIIGCKGNLVQVTNQEAPQSNNQIVSIPKTTEISPLAFSLIVNYEVTSEDYYDRYLSRPTWPGGDSGCTYAIGTDAGYETSSVLRSDFYQIEEPYLTEIANSAGLTGRNAQSRVKEIQDVLISWDIANNEFKNVELTRYYQGCIKTFSGFTNLTLNAQGAILSYVYNRGFSITGPSRIDVRNLKDAIANQDYKEMAHDILHTSITMESAWKSEGVYEGLNNRRIAETQLLLTP